MLSMAIVTALVGTGIAMTTQSDVPTKEVSTHQTHTQKTKPEAKTAPQPEQAPAPPKSAPAAPAKPKAAAVAPAPTTSNGRVCIAPNSVESEVNNVRAQHGLPTLCINAQLRQAAINRGNDMCARNVFSHDGYQAAIAATGYSAPSGWLGENIAAGLYAGGAAQLVQEWVNSPEHYENIVRPQFTEQGAAVVQCSHYTWNFPDGLTVNIATNDFGG